VMAFLKCLMWQTQTDFDKGTIWVRRICLFDYALWTLLSSHSGIWPLVLLAQPDSWKMSMWAQYCLHQNGIRPNGIVLACLIVYRWHVDFNNKMIERTTGCTVHWTLYLVYGICVKHKRKVLSKPEACWY